MLRCRNDVLLDKLSTKNTKIQFLLLVAFDATKIVQINDGCQIDSTFKIEEQVPKNC